MSRYARLYSALSGRTCAMNGPPIVIARPPGHLSTALLVLAGLASVLSIMLLLRHFGPFATGWGEVVEQTALSRYGVAPLPGRQTVIASMPTRLADAAERGAVRPQLVVELPAGDGTVRRVPGTLIKRLTTIPAHESGFGAAEERHCLLLIAFVAPTVIPADSRVVVRARLASRSLGWLPLH